MRTKVLLILILTLSASVFSQGQQSKKTSNKAITASKLETSGLNFITHDAGINSELSEVGSTFFMNKYLVLSNKKRGFAKVTVGENNTPNNNLFCVNIDKFGNLSYPIVFSKLLDSESNEGGVAFSPDQKTIYLTRAKASNQKQFSLFKAVLDLEITGYWKDVQELDINAENYSIETPAVTADGKKMYFASDMPGGFGGYDLYVADIQADGTVTNPVNLGPTVNSVKNEKYPYVESRYIYFSSEGHENYGGYDVFRASITANAITNRSNIGNTLNTANDEIAFILSSPTRGYISSNKNGNAENFNVYKFELVRVEQSLQALVTEVKSKVALPNAEVTIKNEFGEVIKTAQTDNSGRIALAVVPLTQYTITTSKEGYELHQTTFKAWNDNSSIYSKEIGLTQTKPEITETAIVIENIYFDFNKATVKKESELSLNKIIEVLTANPEMKIAINAHTDAKGAEAYNMTLSKKRAQAAYDYLLKNGISADRLEYKGFGETQLKINCGTICAEKEHQMNRRIEFIIK